MTYNRKILVLVSDPHSGFTLGLTNPETELYDEGGNLTHPEMNDANDYLWNDVYVWALDEILKFADGDPIIMQFLGDLNHGNKYISQKKSTDISDEIFIGEANVDFAIRRLKTVIAIYNTLGTGAHNFGEGAAEKLIFGMLKIKYPNLYMKSLYHGLLEIDKHYTVDFAHHGPGSGIRNWTKGNVARLYLKSIMQDELDYGNKPPDLVVRGHYHVYVRDKQILVKPYGDFESEIIIMPSMCLLSEFARQAGKSPSRVENGLIVKELINGSSHQTIKFTKTLDRRTREIL